MSENTLIDWGVEETPSDSEVVKLSEMHMDEMHEIKITEMKMTNQGYIVCNVETPTLEGNTVWLKGKFGLQNGALSLMRLVGSNNAMDYENQSFCVGKVPSEKSMTGYRYEWTKV